MGKVNNKSVMIKFKCSDQKCPNKKIYYRKNKGWIDEKSLYCPTCQNCSLEQIK